MTERYVAAGELASIMGISQRTVKRWVAEGMPSETWGLRTRRFLPSECVAWARGRVYHDGEPERRANAVSGEPPIIQR